MVEDHAADYDRWFDDHPRVYEAELRAVRTLLPETRLGLEVGVGTGRFAAPLGITLGVDPSRGMAQLARARGLGVCQAFGEQLPFRTGQFDVVLLVTVICFVEDVRQVLREARRVLRAGGPSSSASSTGRARWGTSMRRAEGTARFINTRDSIRRPT